MSSGYRDTLARARATRFGGELEQLVDASGVRFVRPFEWERKRGGSLERIMLVQGERSALGRAQTLVIDLLREVRFGLLLRSPPHSERP
jgi:hypothetical protein